MSVTARYKRPLALALLIAGLGSLPSCGGSTPTFPNRPPPPPPPPPPPTIVFVADIEEPEGSAIALEMTATGTESFTMVLNAAELTDLFGYALDIVYDPTILALTSMQLGAFLDAEGVTVTRKSVETPLGTLIVGQTRVGAVAGVTGSGALLTLEFTALAAGITMLTIQNAGAVDSTGVTLEIDFIGGTVVVPGGT